MIGYLCSLVILVFAACIAQQFVPVFMSLYEARILILPLVFLCSAVTVNAGPMLLLAFICGFLWDAQHLLGPPGGHPQVYTEPVEMMMFGYSIVLYAAMGFLMQGIQPLFREGKWPVSAALSGVAIFLYLTAEFLLITFVRGDFMVTRGVVMKITLSSLLSMLLSPLVFWVLFKLAALFRHTIRYEGLKTNRRVYTG
jgi:cell shape-determining protein MreD